MASIGPQVRHALDDVARVPRRSTARQIDYLMGPKTGVGQGRYASVRVRLARVLGVQSATVGGWLSGRTKPSKASAGKIATAYEAVWRRNNEPRIMRHLSSSGTKVIIEGRVDRGDNRPNPRGFVMDGDYVEWRRLVDAYYEGAEDDVLDDVFTSDLVFVSMGGDPSHWVGYGEDVTVTIT